MRYKMNKVRMQGGFLDVYANDSMEAKARIENWFLKTAKKQFYNIAEPLMRNFFTKHNLKSHNSYLISLRKMPTRWGSCTPKGKIILNPELIKAPKGCIEYVIVHELCHLVHHEHTRKFVDLMTKEMKDWEKWKMKLEKLLA